MAAAVELAVSEAERRAGTTASVYLVGYSIGAALAVHHSLSALEGRANQVDGLIPNIEIHSCSPDHSLRSDRANAGHLYTMEEQRPLSIRLSPIPELRHV
jgi:hypothetical protein